MGGEGAMMAAITSLKNNKRRRKHQPFDKKVGGYGNVKPEYDLPEATPELLNQIKKKILKQQKQRLKVNIILFLIAVIGFIVLLTVVA